MMIGLDGFDPLLAEGLIAAGRLPAFKRFRDAGTTVALEHGSARRTGLAWEHVSTGLSPEDANRWSAVDFDPRTYRAVQLPTRNLPFPARIHVPTVVFDVPYFDLARAPEVRGIVNWAAHDPGVAQTARPESLADEIDRRFGVYPAREWIYGFVWPSAARAERMGRALNEAVDQRFRIAEWMFAERFPDWRLGIMVVSEFHSAAEAMWHGVDPGHPLHEQASSEAARRGLEGVYEAADRALERLSQRFPDVVFVLFNLHGMGANDSDAPSMVLLPELLFRHSFRRVLLDGGRWPTDRFGVPLLREDEDWHAAMMGRLGLGVRLRHLLAAARDRLLGHLAGSPIDHELRWMPASHYQRFWSRMPAFALPAFYDGRIRINLAGREAQGRVQPKDYDAVCDALEALVRVCRNPITGEESVASVERNARPPLALQASEADMVVVWKPATLGLSHPTLGTIGPVPYRRTGGHAGGPGFAWLGGPGIRKGRLPVRSAFDVVPTVLDLLDAGCTGISGRSFAADALASNGFA